MLSNIQSNRGFTLIEVMVVIIILGVLSTLVVVNVIGKDDQAKTVKVKSDLKNISTALALYKLDNGRLPDTQQGLEALVNRPKNAKNWQLGGYLDTGLPQDPWGQPYRYLQPGSRGRAYDLYSVGSDGIEGQRQDVPLSRDIYSNES